MFWRFRIILSMAKFDILHRVELLQLLIPAKHTEYRTHPNYVKVPVLPLGRLSGVYSGTCFHEAPNRDPYYPHHGVVLIDSVNGRGHFGGEFSFFYSPEANYGVPALHDN